MVIDELGEPVFLAQGGSGNLMSTPEATLDRSLRRALEGVPEVDVACACFAGLLNEGQRHAAVERLKPLLPGAQILVEPDYAAALRACPEGTTACVIAGTGSIVCSRAEGRLVKSGGGGCLLGDEGSGFRYGLIALRHFLRNPDHTTESLQQGVWCLFDTADREAITERVYTAASPAALISGLSTALLKDAQSGESYAETALASESQALAFVTLNHMMKHHPNNPAPQLGLAGGLWRRAGFRVAFQCAMASVLPNARVVKSEMPPVRGAALLAMERCS
jgi:N-acetylglucosamine kinase-like BadF-type ATPase